MELSGYVTIQNWALDSSITAIFQLTKEIWLTQKFPCLLWDTESQIACVPNICITPAGYWAGLKEAFAGKLELYCRGYIIQTRMEPIPSSALTVTARTHTYMLLRFKYRKERKIIKGRFSVLGRICWYVFYNVLCMFVRMQVVWDILTGWLICMCVRPCFKKPADWEVSVSREYRSN